MKIRLCYRVDKEACKAEDEYGKPKEVYSCIKLEFKNYDVCGEEYEELVVAGKKLTAASFNVDEKLVIPITLNEYLDNTEEE